MASIFFEPSGTARIAFIAPDGYRRQVRFGRIPRRQAEAIGAMLDVLSDCRRNGAAPPAHVVAWRDSLAESTYAALVRVGLADPRANVAASATLGDLLRRFEAAATVKPSTRAAYGQAFKSLRAFFGDDRPIGEIRPEHAENWRRSLADDGYARATQSKLVKIAKNVFGRAARWELVPRSVFAHLVAGPQTNSDRMTYIERDAIRRVLEVCPDSDWRLVFALGRFAGLRIPSEIVGLTWADVDWERRALAVASPKTEGHAGHGSRAVPIDPELYALLLTAYDAADAGATFIVPRLRDARMNWRTHARRIIRRAGLDYWPRLFQALRSSCEMDWVARFPLRDVAAWIGHDARVAMQHYLKPTEATFRAATEHPARDSKSDPLPTQNATRRALASNRAECTESPQVPADTSVTTSDYACRKHRTKTEMGPAGLEPATWGL